MRRLLFFALVSIGVSVPLGATALQQQVTRAELCALSEHVLLVEVTDVETRWTSEATIGRWAHLAILDRVKGTQADGIDVWLPGGTMGHLTQQVEDVPNLMVNGQYLLFLGPGGSGQLEVLGGAQGHIRILQNGRNAETREEALASVEVCREG